MLDPKEDYDDLADLREEMLTILEQAATIVNSYSAAKKRADIFWITDIETALGSDEHRTDATTMLDTMDEIFDGTGQ